MSNEISWFYPALDTRPAAHVPAGFLARILARFTK